MSPSPRAPYHSFMSKYIFGILLLASTCLADEEPIQIEIYSKNASVQKIPSEFWTKRNAAYITTSNAPVLEPEIRDRILKEVGLEEAFETRDELEKDLFVIRVRNKPIAALRIEYSEIEESKLRALKARLK